MTIITGLYVSYVKYSTHSFLIVWASSPLSTMGVFATVFWIDIFTEELLLHKEAQKAGFILESEKFKLLNRA